MPNSKLYISQDKKFGIDLSDALLNDILSFVKEAHDKETGGILIGQYNSEHSCAYITKITGPPTDSKAGYTWFRRGIKGLQSLIQWSWTKNQYYLGEWHLHPNASANPSYTDLEQMSVIANSKQYNCPEPVLLIIGGSVSKFEIRVFVVPAKKGIVELISVH